MLSNSDPTKFTFAGKPQSEFQGFVERYLGKAVKLSEALSIFIVLSPRFMRFHNGYVASPGAGGDAVTRIACLIAGQQPVPHCRNIQHLISSSAVDADKIDYVSRDAQACGIPVGVDVSRVYLGSSLLKLNARTSEKLGFDDEESLVFALNASGWDTFDEITRSRSTLYQRVYLHPVTRTAEALFARALQLNADSADKGPLQSRLTDAVTLWAESDDVVLDILCTSSNADVASLGRALLDRRFPKKACALAGALMRPQAPFEEILPDALGPKKGELFRLTTAAFENPLSLKSSAAVNSVELENEIIAEAHRIRDSIQIAEPDLVPGDGLRSVVLIRIATLDASATDAPVFQHGELLTADQFTNVRGVVDASEMFRAGGFIMSSSPWREIVLVATQVVLYRRSLRFDRYDIGLNSHGSAEGALKLRLAPITLLTTEDVVRRVGASRERVRRLYATCEAAGYFDELPLLARRTESSNAAVKAVAKRYARFDGQGGWRVTPASVAAFVDQVPPRLRNELLRALKVGTYLGQAEMTSGLGRACMRVAKEIKARKLILVPLSPSSGGAASAFAQVALKGYEHQAAGSLHEALGIAEGEDAIVLLDDNAASGTQSSAQLYAYCGVPRDRWPEALRGETGIFGEALDPERMEKFRIRRFAIAVAIGDKRADNSTRSAAKELELTGFEGVHFDKELTSEISWPAELKSWLSQVGRELIAGDRFGRTFENVESQERKTCEDHAFGYSNFGGVTITPFNVPASTVTALWLPGEYSDRPWVPLFLRRGRLERVILA